MSVPEDLQYSVEHEWIRTLPSGEVEIGITDFAQNALGDIVYVQLPDVGRHVARGEACAEVESVKSVSEIFAPLSGEVTAVNHDLDQAPEQLNAQPYGAGWLMRLRPEADSADAPLLDAQAYSSHVAQDQS